MSEMRTFDIVKAITARYESSVLISAGLSNRGIRPRVVASELFFDIHNDEEYSETGITFQLRDLDQAIEVLSNFSSQFDVQELLSYLIENTVDQHEPLFLTAFRGAV